MNSQNKPENIDDYIKLFPDNVQLLLQKLRTTIRKTVPEAGEAIKYGMPCFTLKGNLLYFAAYNKHIGFYPMPTVITAFKKELASYKTSKGAIQFPIDQPLPLSLIKQMAAYRVKVHLQKVADKEIMQSAKKKTIKKPLKK
jgi:uncharacterized protein YdhG (YjbR/CyaY superfamily)